jgi:hypothetical protein
MNVTREEINQIIRQELREAVKRGELDEGFLDKLLGRGDSPEDLGFVTSDKVKKDLDGVQSAISKLKSTAKDQQNKELYLAVNSVSDKVAELYSMTTPKGEVGRMAPAQRGPGAAVTSMKNMMNDLPNLRPGTAASPANAKRLLKYVFQLKNDGREPTSQLEKQKIENDAQSAINDPNVWQRMKDEFKKAYEQGVVQADKFPGIGKSGSRVMAGDSAPRAGFAMFEEE